MHEHPLFLASCDLLVHCCCRLDAPPDRLQATLCCSFWLLSAASSATDCHCTAVWQPVPVGHPLCAGWAGTAESHPGQPSAAAMTKARE